MSLRQSWIPGLEELGTAATGAAHYGEAEVNEHNAPPVRSTGKAAAAVIRSTNAKVAALEDECRLFRQLYEDLSDTIRKYAEAQREESEAARQADAEHQEEMRSMVAAMSILRQELENAAKDSREVKAAAAKNAMEAREQEEAAAKYCWQWEEEHRQRQELEMANIRMAREGLAQQEKQRGLERECASLTQTVAILEERCKLKETTFVDADNRAAKLQSELLEWRKKGLVLESKLKEETEEKVVLQRLLELERSRKGPKEAHLLRRDAVPTGVEKYKTAGNKQPTIATPLSPEPSAPKTYSGAELSQRTHPPAFKTGIRDAAIRPISTAEMRPSSPERRETRVGRERPGALLPGTYAAQLNSNSQPGSFPQLGDSNPDESEIKAGLPQQETEKNAGLLQHEVEKAVLEALRGAEERCDRAVAAAEARSKQALAQAELDRERAVRVATMDLEARLRKEFAAEKRAIAEAAAAEAMEAAVAAAVEEHDSLHSQIEQLQSKLRHVKTGVRMEGEAVRIVSGSKAHVAAARRQTLLKRVPLVARKDVQGVLGKRENTAWLGAVSNQAKGTDSSVEKLNSSGIQEVPMAAMKGRPESAASLAAENERLRKALSECLSGQRTEGEYFRPTETLRSPRGCGHTQSDVERWESDDERFGQALRAERSDTVVSGPARRAAISDGGRSAAGGDPAIRDGGALRREMLTSARAPGRQDGRTAVGRQGAKTDRVPLWERATRKAELRAQAVAGRAPL